MYMLKAKSSVTCFTCVASNQHIVLYILVLQLYIKCPLHKILVSLHPPLHRPAQVEPQRNAAFETTSHRPSALLALAPWAVPVSETCALHGRRGAKWRDGVQPGGALGLPWLVLPLEGDPPRRRRAVHPAGLPQLVAVGGLQARGLPDGGLYLHGFRPLMLHQEGNSGSGSQPWSGPWLVLCLLLGS